VEDCTIWIGRLDNPAFGMFSLISEGDASNADDQWDMNQLINLLKRYIIEKDLPDPTGYVHLSPTLIIQSLASSEKRADEPGLCIQTSGIRQETISERKGRLLIRARGQSFPSAQLLASD
jgi:hypothetical protein